MHFPLAPRYVSLKRQANSGSSSFSRISAEEHDEMISEKASVGLKISADDR
jgi:hypothetical protein